MVTKKTLITYLIALLKAQTRKKEKETRLGRELENAIERCPAAYP